MSTHRPTRHVFILATLLVTAYLSARGTMDLLAGYLFRVQSVATPHLPPPKPAVAPPDQVSMGAFEVPAPAPASRPVRSGAACPAGLRLVGTIESEDPLDSIALVSDGRRTRLYHGAEPTPFGVARVAAYEVAFEAADGRTCGAVLAWAPGAAD